MTSGGSENDRLGVLPLPLRERAGVRGLGSGMFSHCHSGLFILVIPDVSNAVIPACSFLSFPTFLTLSFPTFLIGNPKAGVKGSPREPEKPDPPAKPPPRSRKKKTLDSR